MTFRMACADADRIAAIVSLAGATFAKSADCRPTEPVAVLDIHGTADDTVTFTGGTLEGFSSTPMSAFPGAEKTVETWAEYDGCAAAGTVNKTEMQPDSLLLSELNHRRRNWPLGTRLDAIVSYRDPLIGDGVVSRSSQDIEDVGVYWATHPYIQSHPRVFANLFQGGVLLHSAVLELRITAALVQGLVEELDSAAAETESLRGSVRMTDSNLPIAGARVLFLDGPNAGRSVTTNAAGEFRFDGLVEGNANLSATAPGYLEARGGLFVDRQAGVQFRLAPTTPITTATVPTVADSVPFTTPVPAAFTDAAPGF